MKRKSGKYSFNEVLYSFKEAPGNVSRLAEILKLGSRDPTQLLIFLMNKCLGDGQIPKDLYKVMYMLLFKIRQIFKQGKTENLQVNQVTFATVFSCSLEL